MIPSPDYFMQMLSSANFSLEALEQIPTPTAANQSIKSLDIVTSELHEQAELLKNQVNKGDKVDFEDHHKQDILKAIETIKQQHEKSELSRTSEIAVRQFFTSLRKFEKEVSRIQSANKVKKVRRKVTRTEKTQNSEK